MPETRLIMGMPVVLNILDSAATKETYERIFKYFSAVDERFSTYKKESEVSRINRGELAPNEYSDDMKAMLARAEETKSETNGYFDIRTPSGTLDPSGIVKGWAIHEAAQMLAHDGFKNFYVEIGGDIQTSGSNAEGKPWSIGIRNPFNREEVVKVVYPKGEGIATSGTSVRGAHIYDPHTGTEAPSDFVSLTVIGPNVYEADRFATAAFAMGGSGMEFLEQLPGFEAYAITPNGRAVMTSGFDTYTTV